MQTPQLENGYTRIANEILDNIVKTKLNGTQYKIIMVVWRYTYGFCRKEHEFSLSFLSEATNTHKKQVQRELNILIEKKIITIVKEANFNNSRFLSFNKIFGQWELIDGEVTNPLPVSEKDTSQVTNPLPQQVTNPLPKKETIKENYKEIYIYYLSLGLIKHKEYTTAMKNAIQSAMKSNKYTIEDCKTLLERHKKVVELTKESEYSVKARPLVVFFGQKVANAKHLICSEYEEGGAKYEKYLKNIKPKNVTPSRGNEFDFGGL